MPLRKKVSYFGLRDFGYDIIDNSSNSLNFFRVTEFPSKFKAGKNLIKLTANPDTLVDGSEVYIEILDYNQNPVYYEPIAYVESDGTRVISIYIYSDTAPGECTVYLAGRAQNDPDTGVQYTYSRDKSSPIYLQIPNVIWSRTSTIAPTEANDTEIIFTRNPNVTVTELIQPYRQPVNKFNVFTQVSSSNATVQLTATPTISSKQAILANEPAAAFITLP